MLLHIGVDHFGTLLLEITTIVKYGDTSGTFSRNPDFPTTNKPENLDYHKWI